MPLIFYIALRHLSSRKRQSVVSLMGITLGVGFFLAISSLMQGSEKDFIHRLVDNSPHITVHDEYRLPKEQPVYTAYPHAAILLHGVTPLTDIRGIRGYEPILTELRRQEGTRASPVLAGEAIVTYAGRNLAITLNGMIPEDISAVTTIEKYMTQGTINDLAANQNGIIIGQELLRKLSLTLGKNITLAAPNGQVRTFKIVGIFRTGRADYDERQAFITLKHAQAFFDRMNRVNTLIIKLARPEEARTVAAALEKKIGYKCVSWQETSEDLLNTLVIRNIIMYTVVSAVLIVAAFGIYNVISTIVMEKQRDIAILKAIGLHARDIKNIFSIQGFILGLFGLASGIPFGTALMFALSRVRLRPPGSLEEINMPIDWGLPQFLIAGAFALAAALFAAFLPARKAAIVQPVDILRGSA